MHSIHLSIGVLIKSKKYKYPSLTVFWDVLSSKMDLEKSDGIIKRFMQGPPE